MELPRARAAVRCMLVFVLTLAVTAQTEDAEEGKATTKPYVTPEVDGLHWAETFDGDVWSRWKASGQDKYNGKFSVEKRRQESLVGDLGLLVPEEAKHYGASATFPAIEGKKEVPFVVQYEVKFQEGLGCGGSYIKLFDSNGVDEFKDDTPYVIMFGPDRCGTTDKVHFILRHRSPKTGVYEEKHFKEPPAVPSDNLSHLYGLVIMPDNSFEILIDGEKKASGNLLTSMAPSVNPPKDIDDSTDKKPDDWVDEAKMDDPAASKPDDWDEDAPMMIPDPQASQPAGWVDDAPKKIADPKALKPEDWDDEEDGEWEAPMIDNPVCSVGCGKWDHPTISNPEYKGKWHAARIDNPEYKGVWKPRQIPNPDYFVDESPCILPKIDSVGIDIWTMSKGILFDNFVIATDPAKAASFADATSRPRRELEMLQQPKAPSPSFLDDPIGFVLQPKIAISAGLTLLCVLAATVWCCCIRGEGAPRPLTPDERRALRKKKKEEQERKKEEQQAEDATREGATATEEQDEPAEEKKEGGLGDIDSKED